MIVIIIIFAGAKTKNNHPKKRIKNNSCPFYQVERIEDFRDRVLVCLKDGYTFFK